MFRHTPKERLIQPSTEPRKHFFGEPCTRRCGVGVSFAPWKLGSSKSIRRRPGNYLKRASAYTTSVQWATRSCPSIAHSLPPLTAASAASAAPPVYPCIAIAELRTHAEGRLASIGASRSESPYRLAQ